MVVVVVVVVTGVVVVVMVVVVVVVAGVVVVVVVVVDTRGAHVLLQIPFCFRWLKKLCDCGSAPSFLDRGTNGEF